MSVKIEKRIPIKEKREVIFDFTQNYSHRLEWDSFLKKAELINAKTPQKGVKAWCVSKYGLGMETEYMSFNRPKVTAVTQSKNSLFFKSFSGSWRFEKLDKNTTDVIFTYSFVLNFPFSLFQSIIKKVLDKNVKQRLRDLKNTLEAKNSNEINFKEIIQLLEKIKAKINKETNVVFAGFNTAKELVHKIETNQKRLVSKDFGVLEELKLDFAPTGTYQEIAISNGWGEQYLKLADEFDCIYKKFKNET